MTWKISLICLVGFYMYSWARSLPEAEGRILEPCFVCPKPCTCSYPRLHFPQWIVNCSSANLSGFPLYINSAVDILDLSDNHFSVFASGTVFPKLKWVSLRNCGIENISMETFCSLLHSTEVLLDGNKQLILPGIKDEEMCETSGVTEFSLDAETLVRLEYIPLSVKHLSIHADDGFRNWKALWKIVTPKDTLTKTSIYGKSLQRIPVQLITEMENLECLELISCNITNLDSLKEGTAIKRKKFYLNLSRNKITRLQASVLQAFSKTGTVSVDFSYNDISEVDTAAFKDISHFDTLIFDHNRIGDNFSKILEAVKHTKIRKLTFFKCNMDQKTQTMDTFSSLQNTDIQVLNLRENRFVDIDADNFYHVPNLQETGLSLFVHSKGDSHKSRLNALRFAHISNLAGDTGYHLFATIQAINMERLTISQWNKALRPPGKLPWKTSLKLKEIEMNDVECGYGFDLRLLTKLEVLSMTRTDCLAEDISFPENSEVKKLVLNFNLKVINLEQMTELFVNMPKLQILDLSDSPVKISGFTRPFMINLQNLLELYLSNTNLKSINPDFFSQTSSLKIIDLSHNRLDTLPHDLFRHTRNLQVVYLQGNVLQALDPSMFDYIYSGSLHYLDISHNNIRCGCDLRTLTAFLQSARRNALVTTCDPSSMLNVVGFDDACIDVATNKSTSSLIDYQIHWMYCDNNLLKLFFTISCVFIFLVTLVASFIYKYRFSLLILVNRLYLSLCRPVPSDFSYDCYVSYTDTDSEFVQELYEQLAESDDEETSSQSRHSCNPLQLKIALKDKDFLPGSAIIDEITSHMDSSKNILFVLSEAALKDVWCQFEAEYGVWNFVVNSKRQLIVLQREEISTNSMCVSLKSIMNHAIVIKTYSCSCTRKGLCTKITAILSSPPGCLSCV